MRFELVALDLDGTLLRPDNRLSSATLDAVRRVADCGIAVAIATGRMHRSATSVAESLGVAAAIISYNGAFVHDANGEELLCTPIELPLAREALAFFRRRGWYVQSYVDDVLLVEKLDERARSYGEISGVQPVVIGEALYDPQKPPLKLLSIGDDEEHARHIRDEAKAYFGERLFAAISNPLYFDLASPKVSKGEALKALRLRLGIERERTLVVGDSENDLPMFAEAGFSVAMGNASAEVRRAASAVTMSNAEDGAAAALLRYVL